MTFIHKKTFIPKKRSIKEDASFAYLAVFFFESLSDCSVQTVKEVDRNIPEDEM